MMGGVLFEIAGDAIGSGEDVVAVGFCEKHGRLRGGGIVSWCGGGKAKFGRQCGVGEGVDGRPSPTMTVGVGVGATAGEGRGGIWG